MNVVPHAWDFLQKFCLLLALPLLLFLGLRHHKNTLSAFAFHAGLAFMLLAAVLAVLAWRIYENSGLLWPGALSFCFMVVFGSALFRVRPLGPGQWAVIAGSSQECGRKS